MLIASPSLLLFFATIVMSLLLGIEWHTLSPKKRRLTILLLVVLLLGNEWIAFYLGKVIYGKLFILWGQLPLYFIFCYCSGYKGIKAFFVLLTTIVLTGPALTLTFLIRQLLPLSYISLLLMNLIAYSIVICIVYHLLKVPFNYMLQYGSNKMFLLFSIVPLLFCIFSYTRTQYNFTLLVFSSDYFIRRIPDCMVYASYLLVLYIFHHTREEEMLKKEKELTAIQLAAITTQMDLLRTSQEQAVLYRHDLRHHFALLRSFANEESLEQIVAYLNTTEESIDRITPTSYCEHHTINLILSAFASKASNVGARLQTKVVLPPTLPLDDTTLCILLSNTLENALHAVAEIADATRRTITIQCSIVGNKFTLLVENPYTKEVIFENGLPKAFEDGHGFGTRSISALVTSHSGLCTFETAHGIFSARIMLPLTH